MLEKSLQLVTSSHLPLVYQPLDSLFICEEKTLHKQEETFWRWESQGVNYPPSHAELPSLRKGPGGKPEVGSDQEGRRVRNPQQWPDPVPQARRPPWLSLPTLQIELCESAKTQLRSQGLTLPLSARPRRSHSASQASFFICKINLSCFAARRVNEIGVLSHSGSRATSLPSLCLSLLGLHLTLISPLPSPSLFVLPDINCHS